MLRLSLIISCIAVLFAFASPGFANILTPAEVTALNLDPGYTWHYDGTLATGSRHYYTLTHSNSNSLTNGYGTWENCQKEAQAVGGGGDLAIINNSQEDNFLTSEFASLAYTQDQAAATTKDAMKNVAWIGLSKPTIASSDNNWTWVDSTPLSSGYQNEYFRWANGGDSMAQAGDHAYLHMANHPGEDNSSGVHQVGAGKWNANNWHEIGYDPTHGSSGTGLFPMGIIESKIVGTPEPATLAILTVGGLTICGVGASKH